MEHVGKLLRTTIIWLLLLAALMGVIPRVRAGVRIKDITDLEGSQSNHLVGFGLVVGLNGTGSKSTFTQQVAVDMLQRFMVTTKIISDLKGDSVFKSGNIAAVMVTAELGPVARMGSRIDVTVSVLDDASSLDNGVLILTPLKGVDGVEYVVAQGPVSVGGFLFTASGGGGGTAAAAQKNHPTVGRISNGPIVVREARGKVVCDGQLKILLREPDYDTARAIAKVINDKFAGAAFTVDAGTVHIFVPHGSQPATWCRSSATSCSWRSRPIRRPVSSSTNGPAPSSRAIRCKISTVAVTHGNLAIVTNNDADRVAAVALSAGEDESLAAGATGRDRAGQHGARAGGDHDGQRFGAGAERVGRLAARHDRHFPGAQEDLVPSMRNWCSCRLGFQPDRS